MTPKQAHVATVFIREYGSRNITFETYPGIDAIIVSNGTNRVWVDSRGDFEYGIYSEQCLGWKLHRGYDEPGSSHGGIKRYWVHGEEVNLDAGSFEDHRV